MDIEQLEKQLSMWNKLMYMTLGAVITLVISSPEEFAHVDIVWFMIQIAITPLGFLLLFSRRWRALASSRERINTGLGFLFASWLSLLVPWILGARGNYVLFLLIYMLFLGLLSWRVQRKLSNSDEMFP